MIPEMIRCNILFAEFRKSVRLFKGTFFLSALHSDLSFLYKFSDFLLQTECVLNTRVAYFQ